MPTRKWREIQFPYYDWLKSATHLLRYYSILVSVIFSSEDKENRSKEEVISQTQNATHTVDAMVQQVEQSLDSMVITIDQQVIKPVNDSVIFDETIKFECSSGQIFVNDKCGKYNQRYLQSGEDPLPVHATILRVNRSQIGVKSASTRSQLGVNSESSSYTARSCNT
jgi:hypothetical protein